MIEHVPHGNDEENEENWMDSIRTDINDQPTMPFVYLDLDQLTAFLERPLSPAEKRQHEQHIRHRKQFDQAHFGVTRPDYLPEDDMPRLDLRKLEAYVAKQLPADECHEIAMLICKYHSWSKAESVMMIRHFWMHVRHRISEHLWNSPVNSHHPEQDH